MGKVCLFTSDGKKGGTTKQTRPFVEGGVFLFLTYIKEEGGKVYVGNDSHYIP
jgi:hypothetical protein